MQFFSLAVWLTIKDIHRILGIGTKYYLNLNNLIFYYYSSLIEQILYYR